MKPAIIAIIVLVCCLLSSSAGGAYFMLNASPAPEPEEAPEPEKVPGCTDSTATNYNPKATEDDGSCIATVMGCMRPEAFNFSPEANTDDGSCVDYVTTDSFSRSWTPTDNPAMIDENNRTLKILAASECKDKEGQQLMNCGSEHMQVCKNVCDENQWCKGVLTSLNEHVKKHGNPLYCDFAKPGEVTLYTGTVNDDTTIGYFKA